MQIFISYFNIFFQMELYLLTRQQFRAVTSLKYFRLFLNHISPKVFRAYWILLQKLPTWAFKTLLCFQNIQLEQQIIRKNQVKEVYLINGGFLISK